MAATLTGANALSKSFHAGKACEHGLLAALLAQNGFTANESAIESAKGFAATASGACDSAAALAEPPLGSHILVDLFKFDASCYMTHSTLAGIRELCAQHDLHSDEIAALHLGVDCADSVIAAVEMPAAALDVRVLTRVTGQVLFRHAASLGDVSRQLAPKRRIHDSG
jgi:2-methylcitrate dehydratase PrpD